jgi:hypothetical protein
MHEVSVRAVIGPFKDRAGKKEMLGQIPASARSFYGPTKTQPIENK